MLITMLVAADGVSRTLLRRLLGGWAFALALRREAFASLDVSYTAAAILPPSRRCRVNGTLRASTCHWACSLVATELTSGTLQKKKLYDTDASPSGDGGCVAPVTQEAWLSLHDLAEENTCALTGKGKNHRATCTMAVQPLHHLLLN